MTSVVAAVQVRKIRKLVKKSSAKKTQAQSTISKSKQDNEEMKYDNNETIELETKSNEADEEKEKDRTNTVNSNNKNYDPNQDSTYSKNLFKHWAKLVWSKKKVYWGLVPHIFDQATDISVAVEYWFMYKNNENVGDLNPLHFFISTVFFLLLHRIVSTITLVYLTRNPWDVLLQTFDLLLAKAIWTNYKLGSNEPSNIQRYLSLLEATFESSPQIAISTVFIMKSTGSNPIIIASLCFSLWSLISRVVSDDKTLFKEQWQSLEFDKDELCRCGCVNRLFLFRLFWRLLEITNRIFVATMIWLSIGGFGLSIIICVEFMYCLCLCFAQKTPDAMGNIMYLTYTCSGIPFLSEDWRTRMLVLFWYYRVVTFYLFMIIITIFSTVSFEANKVEEFETRKHIITQNDLGLFMFIYAWITGPLWHCIGFQIFWNGFGTGSVVRDLAILAKSKAFDEILQLLEFGIPITQKNVKVVVENTAGYCYYREKPEVYMGIMKKCLKENPDHLVILLKNNAFDELLQLLEFGIQITQKNDKVVAENTLKHCDKADVAISILDKCTYVNTAMFGTTDVTDDPLYYALRYNKPLVVEYLFAKGSKITEKKAGKIFDVVVNYYFANDITEIMNKCLKANPNAIHEKNFFGWKPIHCAVENRDIKIVQYLLDNGANINAVNYDNKTPLMKAEKDINKELLVLLLSQDTLDILVENKEHGRTYYDNFQTYDGKENLAVVDQYFHQKGNGDCSEKHGLTKLQIQSNEKNIKRCNVCAKRISQKHTGYGYWEYIDIDVIGCMECNYYECANCTNHR